MIYLLTNSLSDLKYALQFSSIKNNSVHLSVDYTVNVFNKLFQMSETSMQNDVQYPPGGYKNVKVNFEVFFYV